MTDEIEGQEPVVEEGAQPAEERAPLEVAEPEIEEEEKEIPDTKALREARRDAKKAQRRAERLEKELERRRRMGPMVAPSSPMPDDPERLRQEAMAFRQIQQQTFVGETLDRLGLTAEDSRLDYSGPETFLASAAVAKMEELEDREAELEDKEKKLESLGDKLRADIAKSLEEEKRKLRHELGMDKVAKVTPATGTGTKEETAIRAKYQPRLDILKHSGQTAEAYRLLKEMEAEIEAARIEK